MAVKQNKLALPPLDSKCFLLFNGIWKVSYGHKDDVEIAFLEYIYMKTDWVNSYIETDSSSPEFQLQDRG